MSAVHNIQQFKAAKAALIAKWGAKLVYYSGGELRQIEVDCAPLAKYAKMPVDRIHMALVNTYFEQQEQAK